MTDLSSDTRARIERSLSKRRRAEIRFQLLTWSAVIFAMICLMALLMDIGMRGYSSFTHTYIDLEVSLEPSVIKGSDSSDEQAYADYQIWVRDALQLKFSIAPDYSTQRELFSLVSNGAGYQLKQMLDEGTLQLDQTIRVWLLADDQVDRYVRHGDESQLTRQQKAWVNQLRNAGDLEVRFNRDFFINGDSREPEQAGIRGALMGSLLTLLITFVLSMPLGIGAAIYLEEYAVRSRFTDLVDVSINNLAAVPSIIFGLLGLAVFINVLGVPRSVPLAGGLVLTLMTLPTVIIASRSAIQSVPQFIRDAALSMGASKMQVTLQHVLPLAMPGMLTGSIIGMAQALGETAPLLMIGMVAFIVDTPASITDPATALPVQIFLWAESPEQAFIERAAGAIIILLAVLLLMQSIAAIVRRRLERKW